MLGGDRETYWLVDFETLERGRGKWLVEMYDGGRLVNLYSMGCKSWIL